MNVLIVLPTYNERPNIERVAEAIMTHPWARLLVVDDGSPDGTGAIADGLAQKHQGRIEVMHRTGPRGLGLAYVDGLRHALATGADAIGQMDADLSHRPEDVPRLIAAIEGGAEFAIGSRYVDGGRVPHDWPALRRLNSRLGNLLARRLLRLGAIHDCTAGFRAIRGFRGTQDFCVRQAAP